MEQLFSWIITRDCKRYFKRHYTLLFEVDEALVEALGCFGFLEENRFSQYDPRAQDCFKVSFEELCEITGALGNTYLIVTINRDNPEWLEGFEKTLYEWSTNKRIKK